jgi:hypothetical protein
MKDGVPPWHRCEAHEGTEENGRSAQPQERENRDDNHDHADDVEDVHYRRSLFKMFRKNISSAAMFLPC